MASEFLREFAQDVGLSDVELTILAAVDVRSEEDIDSALTAFPSLADLGVRSPVISSAAANRLSAAYLDVARNVSEEQPIVALGAIPPVGVSFGLNSTVPVPSIPAPGYSQAMVGAIDLRPRHWPVKNQGDRGTCVAFGAAACVEHLNFATGQANAECSEQFLYWAIKTHSGDPRKQLDGTLLSFARDMLGQRGICRGHLWPYVRTRVNPVSGQTATAPTAAANADGAMRRHSARWYMGGPPGAASIVRKSLQAGCPVAVSLPVFRDPLLPNGPHNWVTPVGWAFGRVLNPPPRSVAKEGHCVCITGFVPDPIEPAGGYFIVRNSWNRIWARSAPAPGKSHSPEQGYGEVSASYIDNFCWELLHL